MTRPPPVLAGPLTGDRGMRRRAPVSDRPGHGLLAESSLPLRGDVMPLPESEFYVGIDWAAETRGVRA
jgi:hypothetical protein